VSTIVWIIGWAVVLGVLAFFAIREIRSGRKGPADFDRTRHQSVNESAARSQMTGPGASGMLGG
jgi:hypothetical protein